MPDRGRPDLPQQPGRDLPRRTAGVTFDVPFIYWLGYRPFKATKRDRYPHGTPISDAGSSIGRAKVSKTVRWGFGSLPARQTSVCRCGRSSMAEPEVVALATRDRNPPATPAGIRPNIGWVAQSVERRCEEPEVAGSVPAPSTKHACVPSRIPSTTDAGTQVIFAPVAKPDKASGFEPEDLGVRVSPGAPI